MRHKALVWLTFAVGIALGIMGNTVAQQVQSACGLG